MPAKKTSKKTTKKTTKKATKKTSKPKAAAPARAKKSSAGDEPAAKAAAKPAAARKKTAAKGKATAEGVNLGHIFALRPRVPTAFPQEAFRRAKDELREESFDSIEDAARAVAEKALGTSHKKPGKHGFRR